MQHSYIVIEGNIGAGKTSLVHLLADKYKGKKVLEGFSDNPFLPKFYKQPERYAFAVEMSFLSDRFHQLNNELRQQSLFNQVTIADYSLSKSLIFASTNLEKDEFDLFNKMYQIMMSNLPKPGLIVYLHRNIDQLQKNILKRGRDYEQDIADDYLVKIQDAYIQFLKQQELKVLFLDLNETNFINNSNTFNRICELINQPYKVGIHNIIF
jgi:deoxyadenosine/deoxycytidine kinase